MACTIRVGGKNFDVMKFRMKTKLTNLRSFQKGQPRYPHSQPKGPKLKHSVVLITASDADFSKPERQVREAIAFLQENKAELRKLIRSHGVEFAEIDFGIELRRVFMQCDYFPPELLLLAGSLGLGLDVSVYAVTEKEKALKRDIAEMKRSIRDQIEEEAVARKKINKTKAKTNASKSRVTKTTQTP